MAKKPSTRKKAGRTSSPQRVVEQEPPAPEPVPPPDPTAVEPGPQEPALYITGVGASAGGLEAFSQLLRTLPSNTEMALVLVQHLAPLHSSSLTELLSETTKLPVVQVTEGMRIERGHVYVIPPNAQLGIRDGALHLVPRPGDRTQYNPIDIFFRSLAEYAQSRAIGVILSGTASDGSVGLREIKAVGGITIAQKPETAKYDGMPRAAIATGSVDLVLAPEEIARELARIVCHPYLKHAMPRRPGDDLAVDAVSLQRIVTLLRKDTGVDFTHYKTPTIKRRLQRRMALFKISSIEQYLRYLHKTPGEVQQLYHDILIHVTRFFREPESFAALREGVFPKFASGRTQDSPIRIWVPGCSTGEEPYSLGIELLDWLGERSGDVAIQIFATDISEPAIAHARGGVYADSISSDVSAERLRRYFTGSDGSLRINNVVRDLCIFARHDLTRDPPFSRMDLILCRNVLIYLDTALQRRLLRMFHYALKPNGYLMLGTAETVGPHGDLFAIADKKHRIYSKRVVEVHLAPVLGVHFPMPAGEPAPHRTLTEAPPVRTVFNQANRLLLDRYAPPSILVDGDWNIVQTRGHTAPYLELAPGEPSLNALKMVRQGLLHALRDGLNAAMREGKPVKKENIWVAHDGGRSEVGLMIVPVQGPEGRHFLVIFQEPSAATQAAEPENTAQAGADLAVLAPDEMHQRFDQLQKELTANREYLQSIIQDLEAANEELQSANEEILSSNEELQSTNEELDTAKEELQSSNEELNTVNEELQGRNEELGRVNSDLLNLLASVQIAIVIISQDLRIRRFTPTAEKLLNLIPTDMGRPIGQIRPNLELSDLENSIRRSIDSVSVIDREVRDRDGNWHSLRIRPYKDVDNRIDGAVLTLISVDTDRRQKQLTALQNLAQAFVETVRVPLIVLEHDLRVRAANAAFSETFRIAAADARGIPFFGLGNGEWDFAELHQLLEEDLPKNKRLQRVRIEHAFPRLGHRVLEVDVARSEDGQNSDGLLLLAIEDVTGRE
jgi:two-component system CheB/CheR fusion protein